jgi:signal transduction histidine kinase
MPGRRSPSLSFQLALASLVSAVAVALVCVVGLVSLRNIASVSRSAVTRQIAALDESRAFAALLYQKGFLAHFMLTGDRAWLAQVDARRAAFETWLASAGAEASTPERRDLVQRIRDEYRAYDTTRRHAVALFDAGQKADAIKLLSEAQLRTETLLTSIQAFGDRRRRQAEDTMAGGERATERLTGFIVITSVLGAIASIAAGFLWARRFARPIYELRLRAESAAQRMRLQVDPRRGDLDGLAEHVTGLLARLEEIDGTVMEQRRRLAQNEKLSEIGELAAKLAHELLNPMAGMKAAIQLLARAADAGRVPLESVGETARALDVEITRVEQLVRRLVDYARPLSPRFEPCEPGQLVASALDVSRREVERSRAVVRQEVEPGLPPLEADPLLVTQALANLICNAAQASPPCAVIDVEVRRALEQGCEQVVFEVRDRGQGVPAEDLPRLFRPFFTTKPNGHGLGLAVSHHIAVEHGGRIIAHNRDGGGARFQLAIPVVR